MANAQEDVTALLHLINSSVNKLTAAYGHTSQTIPSLNGLTVPQSGTPDLHGNVDVTVLAAACDQLKATFVKPEQELFAVSIAHQLSAALGVAIEGRVAEGLRKAPVQGVHIDVLARPSGLDPQILARCLRLLADNHVFREISPDTFAHTRLSLPLDTGKPIELIFSERDPAQLYAGTNGIVATLSMNCVQASRISARLLDWLREQGGKRRSAETDPPDGSLGWTAPTPFQLAFGTKQTYFEWLSSQPEQQALFQAAMVGHASIRSSEGPMSSIVDDFLWSRLSNGDLVVDVGGGNGSALLPLVEAHPHVRFVVQDLQDVEPQFNAFWGDSTHHLSSGQITFQAHSFFDQNPVSKAAIYHLRNVLHDWPDPEAVKILSRVAEAAGPASYVAITDLVTPVTADLSAAPDARSPSDHAEIPGIAALPTPLTTPNTHHGGMVHRYDLAMLCAFASVERTADHWRRLLDEVGLRVAYVVPGSYSGSAKPGTLICVKK